MPRKPWLAVALMSAWLSTGAWAATSDLTIEVGGELLEHGGVVIVYHLPVAADEWAAVANASPGSVRIDHRFAEVQIRYPADGTFTYRFHPVPATPKTKKHVTNVLSILGTNSEGHSVAMRVGFAGAVSSGGRVVRVPSMKEIAGDSETDRTNAKWGVTERNDDPPPADERSARGLAELLAFASERPPFACDGDARIRVCTVVASEWPAVETRWWRAIAEMRLGRLDHYALRRCYEGGWLSTPSFCNQDPNSNEPKFVGRD